MTWTVTSPVAGLSDADRIAPGTYLTDGAALYRVIDPIGLSGSDGAATLENCMTLDVRMYTADELWRMGLRLVRAAAVCA